MIETTGPIANLKDCNFPTQEANLFTGKILLFEISKKKVASSKMESNFFCGISNFIETELIIRPKY